MKQAFIHRKFSPAAKEMIDRINNILDDYRRQGFRLSLRQLYYQLVARAIIPNSVKSYKRIGDLVSNARQAGLIDWDMIEDRNRETLSVSHWDSPADIIDAAAASFRIDKWADQPIHIEVMVEKDALSGVLVPVCRALDISITANKGYSSSSTMYEIGQRLGERYCDDRKEILVIYLGDHDPSGIDMTRDVEDRLTMYASVDEGVIEVVRLALNYDQVQRWSPPENPAKQTDSRFSRYAAKFGESSWELDAIEPARLAQLVRDLVEERRDPELWDEAVKREELHRQTLRDYAREYREDHHA